MLNWIDSLKAGINLTEEGLAELITDIDPSLIETYIEILLDVRV